MQASVFALETKSFFKRRNRCRKKLDVSIH
jgi:hypothetical protein